jgi:hypothetical protein
VACSACGGRCGAVRGASCRAHARGSARCWRRFPSRIPCRAHPSARSPWSGSWPRLGGSLRRGRIFAPRRGPVLGVLHLLGAEDLAVRAPGVATLGLKGGLRAQEGAAGNGRGSQPIRARQKSTGPPGLFWGLFGGPLPKFPPGGYPVKPPDAVSHGLHAPGTPPGSWKCQRFLHECSPPKPSEGPCPPAPRAKLGFGGKSQVFRDPQQNPAVRAAEEVR